MRVKEKDAFEGLKRVARRYSENFEFAVVAAAYSVLTAIKKGMRFPLPSLDEIFKGEEDAPSFVREFIKKSVGNHWSEYQAIPGMFDEDRLVDFFADEAIGLLANARQVCVPDASVHALAAGLLDLDSKDRVCDLDCKIGSFVNTAWFRLWDVSGSDEGLEVTGVSTSETSAALTYIVSHANGVNATIRNADIFRPEETVCDKVFIAPPFGVRTQAINMVAAQQSLGAALPGFPEIRLSTADWVYAARALSLTAEGGRTVVALPLFALSGSQHEAYRRYFISKKLVEGVVTIPQGFLHGTAIGFSLVVLKRGSDAVKFVDGGEYVKKVGNASRIDVERLLKDYRNLADYEAVTTKSLDKVYENECNLAPEFYLGEDLNYANAMRFGDLVSSIERGARVSVNEWAEVESATPTSVKKLAYKNIVDGIIGEDLVSLTTVPDGGESGVLNDGDLLVSRIGLPFKIAVVDGHFDKTLVADENVIICRMKGNKERAYYLRAFLESKRGQTWLARLSSGAVSKAIASKGLAKIPVPKFDEESIRKIATDLQRATILVKENQKRLLESLAAMKNVFDTFNKDGGL